MKLIRVGRLIDGLGGKPLENAYLLVEGSRIKEVGEGAKNISNINR